MTNEVQGNGHIPSSVILANIVGLGLLHMETSLRVLKVEMRTVR